MYAVSWLSSLYKNGLSNQLNDISSLAYVYKDLKEHLHNFSNLSWNCYTVQITHLAICLSKNQTYSLNIIRKALTDTRRLTNSEWRSFEMPCILAECWMTRSNRLARERTWHPAWALVQMGAAPTLVSLLQNNRQTNTTHTADTRGDQRPREKQRN